MTKPGRDERRNPDALLQIDKGGALSKKHVCFDKKKKSSGILFCTSTYRGFCCRLLCIAPVQLQCKVIGDWPLRAARGNGTSICTTHTCSERLLVGEKAKPLIFAWKKESCFPKVEYTWNWNARRTKASLRHWKRENWNIFENIWKKSNTPQGSVFLEWTIVICCTVLLLSKNLSGPLPVLFVSPVSPNLSDLFLFCFVVFFIYCLLFVSLSFCDCLMRVSSKFCVVVFFIYCLSSCMSLYHFSFVWCVSLLYLFSALVFLSSLCIVNKSWFFTCSSVCAKSDSQIDEHEISAARECWKRNYTIANTPPPPKKKKKKKEGKGWGPVVQWLVQRFRSERLRVRSRRSATFTPSAHVRRQSLPVWPPTLNNYLYLFFTFKKKGFFFGLLFNTSRQACCI